MEKFFGNAFDKYRDETLVEGNDDVNSPMYRNNTGYGVEFDNKNHAKIKN